MVTDGGLSGHLWFNHNDVVSSRALENSICGDLVVHDHGVSTGRLALRSDDGAEVNLAVLFHDLEQDLHHSLIAQSVEEEVIKNEEPSTAYLLQSFLVLHVVKAEVSP